jgi:hypothetical protein
MRHSTACRALAALGVFCTAGVAHAEPAGESVVIIAEGPGADDIRGGLEDRVSPPHRLEDGHGILGALTSKGTPSLHAAAANRARDAQLIARVRGSMAKPRVDVAVLVDVRKTPRATHVHLWNISGQHAAAVVDRDITLPPGATTLEETRAIAAVSALPAAPEIQTIDNVAAKPTTAENVSAPAAAPADADTGIAATPTARSPGGRDADLFAVQAGLGVGMRRFSYVQSMTSALRPYDLAAAPVARVEAEVYPFSTMGIPVLRDFGVTGDYARAFALSSEDSNGSHVGTSWQSFDVGAKQRFVVARWLLASVSAGYGGDDFRLDQSLEVSGQTAALPTTAYRFVRAGGDVRVAIPALPGLSVFGGGSYLDILSTGSMGQLFSRETVGGIDGHVGASYGFAKRYEVSLGASYTRFFYSFNPVPGDTNVAGGALDEQTRISAAFAYLM